MDKINREIDKDRMKQSKQKTIAFVMNEINKEPIRSLNKSFFKVKLVPAFALLFALVLVIVFTVSSNPSIPITPNNPLLDNTNQERLVELSYITGNLVVSSFLVDTGTSLMRLSDTAETEFEENILEFNAYFDILKVFLEDDPFKSNFNVETLEEGIYPTKITFTVDSDEYIFLLNLDDTILTGTLEVRGIILQVTGKLEEINDKLNFDIKAINGLNYIRISYQVETDDEIEKNYKITSYINGFIKNKTINISVEDDKAKVKIQENNKEFQLKKEIEDGYVKYKLTYKIGEVEGEATIFETVDPLGKLIYKYQISEDGFEKEIDIDKDDDDDDDDDNEEDQMNPNLEEYTIYTV